MENFTTEFEISYIKDGSKVTDVYAYNFLKMTMARIFQAEQLFILDSVRKDEQLTEVIQRSNFQKAMSLLFIKKTDLGFVVLNEEQSLMLFDYMTGEHYNDLMKIKEDFFEHSQVLQPLTMMKYLEPLAKLSNEMPKEQFKSLLDTIEQSKVRQNLGQEIVAEKTEKVKKVKK